jgi:hypothetical protein
MAPLEWATAQNKAEAVRVLIPPRAEQVARARGLDEAADLLEG